MISNKPNTREEKRERWFKGGDAFFAKTGGIRDEERKGDLHSNLTTKNDRMWRKKESGGEIVLRNAQGRVHENSPKKRFATEPDFKTTGKMPDRKPQEIGGRASHQGG